jgi:hypothetical protein
VSAAATSTESIASTAAQKKSHSAAVDFAKALDDTTSPAPSSSGDGVLDKLVDAGSLAATIAAFA